MRTTYRLVSLTGQRWISAEVYVDLIRVWIGAALTRRDNILRVRRQRLAVIPRRFRGTGVDDLHRDLILVGIVCDGVAGTAGRAWAAGGDVAAIVRQLIGDSLLSVGAGVSWSVGEKGRGAKGGSQRSRKRYH